MVYERPQILPGGYFSIRGDYFTDEFLDALAAQMSDEKDVVHDFAEKVHDLIESPEEDEDDRAYAFELPARKRRYIKRAKSWFTKKKRSKS